MQKLMPCKYFTLILFLFILKLHLLKLKHFEGRQAKMVIKMPAFEMLLKVNRYTNSSMNTLWAAVTQPSLPSLPPISLAVLKPVRNVWVGHSLLHSV
jgi:hypothetical protein